MNALENPKLITSVLPKGKAVEVVKLLHKEKDVHSTNIASGRGVLGPLGQDVWSEVDIMTVVINEDRADEIFEYIYFQAEIDRVHGGLMFQGELDKSTIFALPDLPEEMEGG